MGRQQEDKTGFRNISGVLVPESPTSRMNVAFSTAS